MKYIISIIIIIIYTYLNAASSFADGPKLEDLIAQLNGKHCKYEYNYNLKSESCRPRSLGGQADLTAVSKESRDCKCRGLAARCLAVLKEQAHPALPHLLKYLSEGPGDIYTGDGIIQCLTPVIKTIGEIKDSSSIPYLINYLKSPRKIKTDTESAEFFIGTEAAVMALANFKNDAADALPVLSQYINPESDKYRIADKYSVLTALSEIGGKNQITAIVDSTVGDFKLLNNSNPTTQGSEAGMYSDEIIRLEINLKLIEKLYIKYQFGSENLNKLYDFLIKFKLQAANWVAENSDYHDKSQNAQLRDMQTFLQSTKACQLVLIRILARSADPRVIEFLPELIVLNQDVNESVNLISNYGKSAKVLTPVLLEKVGILRMQSDNSDIAKDSINREKIEAISKLLSSLSLK